MKRVPDSRFFQAVAEFNRQAFFECHETLEDIWRPLPPGLEKTFYQGLLQVGVGFHHLRQGNRTGTLHLLGAGLEKLRSVEGQEPFESWIDLRELLQETQQIFETLQDGPFEAFQAFPAGQLPQIKTPPP